MSRLFLSLVFLLSTMLAAHAKPVRYMLEANKSSVGFVYHFNGNPTKGIMPVAKADLTIDFAALHKTTVRISLNVKKARAGFIFATEALREKSVLDVANHPQILFSSTKVSRTNKGARVVGMVTIRGVTKPLTLNAVFYRQKGSAPKDLSKLSILLTGSISRAAFGATGYPKLVGDRIDLRILARIRQVD
jgi:polyisoprenoid-binding protein YceI